MKFFKKKTFRCNSRKIAVFRDPNDAIPVYVVGITGAAKASLDAAQDIKGTVEAQYQEQITGISTLVSNTTEDFLMEFRLVYHYYSESPCEREQYFQDKLSELLREKRRFEIVRLHLATIGKLAASGTSSEKLLEIYDSIVQTLSRPTQQIEMAQEFAKVPKLIEGWS